jgi:Putative transposase/Transposase zinc-binding domain
MVAIAEIFRLHGPAYRAQCGDRRLPSPRRAMQAIEQCRTEALGGQVYHGETCLAYHYSYHSGKNRPCPKCQQDQAQQWLAQQQRLLLPVPHVLVTFTLPAAFRTLARRHQKTLYNLLFRSSSEALQELALEPRFIGGRSGMVGVLHTGTRDLHYHPHVHDIVAGGGLSAEGTWRPARHDFLVHVTPLSVRFRAKFRAYLQKTDLFPLVDAPVWSKDWVVHCKPVGNGEEAFRSLAPYIFRVALSNNRLLKLEDGQVTFQDTDSATDRRRAATVPAEEFMRRFLQHVLPDRFIKVRYDGFLCPGNRPVLTTLSTLLGDTPPAPPTTAQHLDVTAAPPTRDAPRGPKCGNILTLVETLRPHTRSPP